MTAKLIEQYQTARQAEQYQAEALYRELVERADDPKPADAKRLAGVLTTLGRTIGQFDADVARHQLAEEVAADDLDALQRAFWHAHKAHGRAKEQLGAERETRAKRLEEAKRFWEVAAVSSSTPPNRVRQLRTQYQDLKTESERVLADLQSTAEQTRGDRDAKKLALREAEQRRDRLQAMGAQL